jgi:hypothetical protein
MRLCYLFEDGEKPKCPFISRFGESETNTDLPEKQIVFGDL